MHALIGVKEKTGQTMHVGDLAVVKSVTSPVDLASPTD